ncbi:MAG: aminoacyl-tRNA hydrolase [Ruminococcaceae bacterium]|nr:aminoacyl-tRNA hydrolase [Oscillospiraceae bacterium]
MSNIFDLFKQIEKKNDVQTGNISYLIVGLGNPGDKYAKTRHNVGFMTLDYIAQKLNIKINKSKFKALVCDTELNGKRVLFMKPQTFMNNSGEAVREAVDFYKIPIENVIIIYDDISLQPGKMRIRLKGSDGGHNGIKSIIYHLNSNEFPRIKIGVGAKPNPEYDLADWVLGNIPEDEQEVMLNCIGNAYESVKLMVEGNSNKAMEKYN